MWQAFLPAHAGRRRQECPRHTGAAVVDGHRSCRYLSLPVGSTGSTGSTGLEDEDENHPPPATLSRLTKCGDKVWRQGVETRCGDKVCHRAAKGQRSTFTL